MQYWWPQHKKEDLIVVDQHNFYKGKIKAEEAFEVKSQLTNQKIPSTLFSIPYTYPKKVITSEQQSYIEVFLKKDDSIQLRIENEGRKMEIFNYLKAKLPNMEYEFKKENRLQKIRGVLIAFLLLNILFLWAYSVAYQIENEGFDGPILVIVGAVAGLGTTLILIILAVVNLTLSFNLIRRLRKVEMQHILRKV